MNQNRTNRIARKLNVLSVERDSLINELDFLKEQDLDESENHHRACVELQGRIAGIEREMVLLHFEYNAERIF